MSSSNITREVFAEAEKFAEACLLSFHDALFEFDDGRRSALLEMAKQELAKLDKIIEVHPEIVAESKELRRHIRWLENDNFLEAQFKIKKDVGTKEFQRLSSENFSRHDYLGKAAEARAAATKHELCGENDQFWARNEEEKEYYLLHADRQGWDREHTLSLVASTFKASADFLRKEGQHVEALRHYLYFLAHSAKLSTASIKRLPAFLSRAGIPKTEAKSAFEVVTDSEKFDDFRLIDLYISRFLT